jgi:kinesin family protein 20
LYGVEPADAADSNVAQLAPEPDLAEVFQSLDEGTNTEFDTDPTTVPVDRNHEYTVWLSYAEVYNEKVYDLLADAKGESDMHVDSPAPRAGNSKSLLLSRKALTLRPSPQSDNPDAEVNGKYISGLRQFRIHSASQAKALVKLGQLHRRVFGTLANRESSRSHGMVIIKVIRGHRGDRNVRPPSI